MNGSTVGDSDTSPHVSGQCHSCGLYTAYGAQFMIASCQTIPVMQSAMRSTGCFGWRRHMTAISTTSCTTMTIVPICSRASQWVQPRRGATGRGAPWTAGFAIRAATAPCQRMRISEGVEQHRGQIAIHHRHAELRTPPVGLLVLVEEALPHRVGLVVLIDSGPTEDGVPHGLVDPGVLERRSQEARRIPAELCEDAVHLEQPEAEAAVHEGRDLRLLQRADVLGDVLRGLGDPLLEGDADTAGGSGLAKAADVGVPDQ